MANVFLSKPNAPKPSALEISDSQYAQYNSNLILTGLINSDIPVAAFEALRFGGRFKTAGGSANFRVNGSNAFVLGNANGSGTNSDGFLTAISNDWQFYVANRYFLSGSKIAGIDNFLAGDYQVRILAPAVGTRFELDNDTDTYSYGTPPAFLDGTPSIAAVVSNAVSEMALQLTENAVEIVKDGVVIASVGRTFQVTATDGTAALTMASTAVNAGSALPFSDTSEQILLGALVGAGQVTVVSAPFLSTTSYVVQTGTTLVALTPPVVNPTYPVGEFVSIDLAEFVDGGVGALTFTLKSGGIPSGMSLSGSLLSGIPTVEGGYNMLFKVRDAHGQTVNISVTFDVVPVANYSFAPHPAVVGKTYEYNPAFDTPVDSATITAGALPNGLSLDEDTGIISGEPTQAGTFPITLSVLAPDADAAETINFDFVSYSVMSGEWWLDNQLVQAVANNDSLFAILNGGQYQLKITGGSGVYSFAISNGNIVNGNGFVRLVNTGDAQLSVTDTSTGEVFRIFIGVAGIKNICGLGFTSQETEDVNSVPCKDVIVQCGHTAKIGFNALTITKGVLVGDTQYDEAVNFKTWAGGNVSNNGKPFAMFTSQAGKAYAVASNYDDGAPFIIQLALDNSVMFSAVDSGIGIAENFSQADNLSACKYAFVFTTVSGERVVQIWKDGVYVDGTQVSCGGAGYEFSFGFFGDTLAIYRNGILSAQTTVPDNCIHGDLVFYHGGANLIFGGKVADLVYSIETEGSATDVGVIDSQTGEYTPSEENVPVVTVKAVKTANVNAIYTATVRVIRPAIMSSLQDALLEGAEVKLWVTDQTRKDGLPVRFSDDGRPDQNQFGRAVWLGNLQGSVKAEPAVQTTDFNDDMGQTSSSFRVQSFNITGVFLQVRDFNKVKRLVPFVKEINSHGVRTLRQYSSGCIPQMRCLIVWQNPHCKDTVIFDCLEFFKVKSYTTLNLEVGSQIQSNIPLVLRAFPDETMNGAILDYNQMRENFVPLEEQ
jgi:hypothetical protein